MNAQDSMYDLIVIGAGPGGYVAAIRAAQLGLRTAVVERDEVGGICLNWGCIPTKSLLRNAEVISLLKRGKEFGFTLDNLQLDFAAAVKRSRRVSNRLVRGVQGLLKKNEIDLVKGEGRLPYASLDSLIESKSSKITLLSSVDLGISPTELQNDPTTVTGLVNPRPRTRKVPPLDSSLPAFYRILQLLEGGISKRSGRMLEGSSEQLADQLFELLKEEGVIKPTHGV